MAMGGAKRTVKTRSTRYATKRSRKVAVWGASGSSGVRGKKEGDGVSWQTAVSQRARGFSD